MQQDTKVYGGIRANHAIRGAVCVAPDSAYFQGDAMGTTKGYIYKIVCLPTGMPYIGETKNFGRRVLEYRHGSMKDQVKLRRSVEKYGPENHYIMVIHELPEGEESEVKKALLALEVEYARQYDSVENGLNCIVGGTQNRMSSSDMRERCRRGQLGRKHSAESIERRRQSLKGRGLGRKISPEVCAIMKAAQNRPKVKEKHRIAIQDAMANNPKLKEKYGTGMRGKHHTEETKRKMSIAHAGKTGRVCSLEQREKLRQFRLGKKQTPETIEKIRLSQLGKKRSPETIAKMKGRICTPETRAQLSASKIGFKHTPEAKAKISATHKGRKHTAQARANMSASKIGIRHTAETKAKISAGNMGKVMSPEARQKMKIAWVARRARMQAAKENANADK